MKTESCSSTLHRHLDHHPHRTSHSMGPPISSPLCRLTEVHQLKTCCLVSSPMCRLLSFHQLKIWDLAISLALAHTSKACLPSQWTLSPWPLAHLPHKHARCKIS